MIRYKHSHINVTVKELETKVATASGFIKTMTGIANNAAWQCCLDALDRLRLHPSYASRQNVRYAFITAMEEFRRYERNLLYAEKNRLFHVADLHESTRKKYGNISDKEYYEYWCATGATAYTQKKEWIANLVNKYLISFTQHGIPHAEIIAWGITAEAMLTLAVCLYRNNLQVSADQYGIPLTLLQDIFQGLNMERVRKRWSEAMQAIEPATKGYELSDGEQRNIQMGLDQLQEHYTSIATMTDAMQETTEAYDDIFRTKGEQKKMLRMIAEIRDGED